MKIKDDYLDQNKDNLLAQNKNHQLDHRTIKPGLYRHYKGAQYQVIDTAFHSETQELLVVYRPLYGDRALWVRPFDMFVEYVDVNNQQVPRFEFFSD